MLMVESQVVRDRELYFLLFGYKLTTKNCVKFVVRFNIFTFCSESELQGLERMPSTFSHLKH